MSPQMVIWLQFLGCVAVIGLAGTRLIREGEAIAAITGLSQSWVGVILLASVTSLPELVTGLSAVTLADAPNLAVGDALGSTVFNLALLALIDVLYRRSALFGAASPTHRVSAGFGIVLLALVTGVLVLESGVGLPAAGPIGLGSVAIVMLYCVAVRSIHRAEQRVPAPASAQAQGALSPVLVRYCLAAIVIVAAGILLPLIGDRLAKAMGWSDSLVGTVFVAFATSVPEAVTVLAAVRVRALDMAMATLLGSNLFDLLILAIDDAAYRGGSLYARVSGVHAVTAATACLMSAAVWLGLAFRPTARILGTGSWVSLLLLGLYAANALVHYSMK